MRILRIAIWGHRPETLAHKTLSQFFKREATVHELIAAVKPLLEEDLAPAAMTARSSQVPIQKLPKRTPT